MYGVLRLPGLSAAQRKFAHSLRDFKFEFIGDAETDDERCIGGCSGELGPLLPSMQLSPSSPFLSLSRCFFAGIFQLLEEFGRAEGNHGE